MEAQKLDSFDALQKHDAKKAEALIQLASETSAMPMTGNYIGCFGQTLRARAR